MSNALTTIPTKTAAIPAFLAFMLAAVPASAQIYRCEEAGATVFSDIPCSEDAELHEMRAGISVVGAAKDLDEIAERNKAFVDQRAAELASRRERADELAKQAERNRQWRAAAEKIRYRTIIGPAAASGFGIRRRSPTDTDPRVEAQRQARDELERRRTLLSRSGGNQRRILR